MGGFLRKSTGGFEHGGVCAAEEVGVELIGYASIAEVNGLMPVAADAHDNRTRYAGGFLQGAKCAAGGMGGEVLSDARCLGKDAEMLCGGRWRIDGREIAPVPVEDGDGEGGKGYLDGRGGFLRDHLQVDDAGGDVEEFEFAHTPVAPPHTGLSAEKKPVAGK